MNSAHRHPHLPERIRRRKSIARSDTLYAKVSSMVIPGSCVFQLVHVPFRRGVTAQNARRPGWHAPAGRGKQSDARCSAPSIYLRVGSDAVIRLIRTSSSGSSPDFGSRRVSSRHEAPTRTRVQTAATIRPRASC